MPTNLNSINKKIQKQLKLVKVMLSYKLSYPIIKISNLIRNNKNKIIDFNNKIPNDFVMLNYGLPIKMDSKDNKLYNSFYQYELTIIRQLEKHFGARNEQLSGYVTSGGTEANYVSLWWLKLYLIKRNKNLILKLQQQIDELKNKINLMNQSSEKNIDFAYFQEYKNNNIQLYELQNNLFSLLNPYLIYSDASHLSIKKICNQLSLQEVTIKSHLGKINIDELNLTIEDIISKNKYAQIIMYANVGTTVHGAIDDLQSINNIITKIANYKEDSYNFGMTHFDSVYCGILLPLFYKDKGFTNYFDELNISSLTISGHKFLGTKNVCGVVLVKQTILNEILSDDYMKSEYLSNLKDITFSGSRSVKLILDMYNSILSLNIGENNFIFNKLYNRGLKYKMYFRAKLSEFIDTNLIEDTEDNLNILIPSPSEKLILRYQLMSYKDKVSCNLFSMNINLKIIDKFLKEYKEDLEQK